MSESRLTILAALSRVDAERRVRAAALGHLPRELAGPAALAAAPRGAARGTLLRWSWLA
jgi:hypothetical protein